MVFFLCFIITIFRITPAQRKELRKGLQPVHPEEERLLRAQLHAQEPLKREYDEELVFLWTTCTHGYHTGRTYFTIAKIIVICFLGKGKKPLALPSCVVFVR